MKTRLLSVAALAAASTTALAGADQAPTNAELYEIIQAQQSQIEDLQGNSSSSSSRTSIGGYGELHYNNIKDARDQIDFHRFILFVNHEFTDRIRLYSELEIEHAFITTEDDPDIDSGAVELEQAFIEFDINDSLQAKGGLFLVPVGILNETHEPPTFYGVERNPVEGAIIPTTWWEAGAALNGHNESGFSWDVAIHSGLGIPGADGAAGTGPGAAAGGSFNIRGGRLRVSNATANDPAGTVRLRYTGVKGLDLATTVQYQTNITQEGGAAAEAPATLFQTHAIYQAGATKLTAFYATWDIDNADFENAGADEQTGYYLEASHKLNDKVGVFARHSEWDNAAGDNTESATDQQIVGVNYWPHENVVLKADIFTQETKATGAEREGFNLGIGYQF